MDSAQGTLGALARRVWVATMALALCALGGCQVHLAGPGGGGGGGGSNGIPGTPGTDASVTTRATNPSRPTPGSAPMQSPASAPPTHNSGPWSACGTDQVNCGNGQCCPSLTTCGAMHQCCPLGFPTDCGNGSCCPSDEQCVGNGQCCPTDATVCRDGTCCPHDTVCAGNNNCCPTSAPMFCNNNGGFCCPNGSVCGQGSCCPTGSTVCADGSCCPSGGQCTPGGACCPPGNTVCPDGSCCDGACDATGICCPRGTMSCFSFCCPTNELCSATACCPSNTVPCGSTCCPAGSACASGAANIAANGGPCCAVGVPSCGGACCESPMQCRGNQCVMPSPCEGQWTATFPGCCGGGNSAVTLTFTVEAVGNGLRVSGLNGNVSADPNSCVINYAIPNGNCGEGDARGSFDLIHRTASANIYCSGPSMCTPCGMQSATVRASATAMVPVVRRIGDVPGRGTAAGARGRATENPPLACMRSS